MTIKYVSLHDISQLEIVASHCDTLVFVLQIDSISFLWLKSSVSWILQIFISLKWTEINIYCFEKQENTPDKTYLIKLQNSYILNTEINSHLYSPGKIYDAMGERRGFLSPSSLQ